MEFHFLKLLVNPDGAVQNRRNTPKPPTELLIVKLHHEWYRHRVLTRKKNAWKYILFWCTDFDCRHAVRSQQSLGSTVSSQPSQIYKTIIQVLTWTFSSRAVYWGQVDTFCFFVFFLHFISETLNWSIYGVIRTSSWKQRSVYSLQTQFMIKGLLGVRAAGWSFELQPER